MHCKHGDGVGKEVRATVPRIGHESCEQTSEWGAITQLWIVFRGLSMVFVVRSQGGLSPAEPQSEPTTSLRRESSTLTTAPSIATWLALMGLMLRAGRRQISPRAMASTRAMALERACRQNKNHQKRENRW